MTQQRMNEGARAVLRAHGAQNVEEAVRANPTGPVQTITTRNACDVSYRVVVGDALLGDHGESREIWSRVVPFGQTDETVAGGADFVAAARAQAEVAEAAYALLSVEDLAAVSP